MSDHIAAAQAETALSPVERARQLSTTIAEAASEIDRQRRLPRTLLDRLHEARLFRLLMPASGAAPMPSRIGVACAKDASLSC